MIKLYGCLSILASFKNRSNSSLIVLRKTGNTIRMNNWRKTLFNKFLSSFEVEFEIKHFVILLANDDENLVIYISMSTAGDLATKKMVEQ